MPTDLIDLLTSSQRVDLPKNPHRIVVLGAGGIVRNAHLPAYRIAGFEIAGIYDPMTELANTAAEEFGIGQVASSIQELIDIGGPGAIFDVATPPSTYPSILEALPDGSNLILQKPMGETLAEAEAIVRICERKRHHATVNFQLRYAPYVLATKALMCSGHLGKLIDIDFKVNVFTPWSNWPFLEKSPRMELVYHSIHYLDLIRDLAGEPFGVYAQSIKHPQSPKLESSRSAVLLDYGEMCRATIHTNHGHNYGPRHQESYFKIEGTTGVLKVQMGMNLDYPKGSSDYFEFCLAGSTDWVTIPLSGSWTPHAFIGPMAAMMRSLEGGELAASSVQDALLTMELVDRCYQSSDRMGVD